MTEFKKGDRVRVKPDIQAGAWTGVQGTVTKTKPSDYCEELHVYFLPDPGSVYAGGIVDGKPIPSDYMTGDGASLYESWLEMIPTAEQQELEDLRAWKAAAIEKHGDLAPVDPDLIEARQIAAENVDVTKSAELCLSGEWDSVLIVQLALKGIKRGRELERNV